MRACMWCLAVSLLVATCSSAYAQHDTPITSAPLFALSNQHYFLSTVDQKPHAENFQVLMLGAPD